MKSNCLLAAFVLSLVPSAASAATIDFLGMGNAQIVTIYGARGGTTGLGVWAGEMNWAWLDGKPAGAANTFYSYCVDIMNDERDPQYNVGVKSTVTMVTDGMMTTGDAAKKAVWLFNTYAADAHTATGGVMAAGLQLAIWEVLFDQGANLQSGAGSNFYVTGSTQSAQAAIQAGQGFLNELNAHGTEYLGTASALWLDAISGQGQDQITRTVPEPGTLLLLGTALAGLAVRRRKMSQA